MELEFSAAYAAVGIRPPTYEPRATASIPQMQELIARLIDRGHAYPADDGSGDVYFDVRSWPSYGELTHQSVDAMEAAEDADPRGKRSPQDFALWKGAKPEEPADAIWDAPWGAGRPGWHIECSAMARRYLGPEFDIHGGGLDLRFPHHENELAQSTAAGDAFARYWVHNGLVTVDGQKMSKSLGNFTLAADVLAAARPARRPLLPRRGALPLDPRPLTTRRGRGGGGAGPDPGVPGARTSAWRAPLGGRTRKALPAAFGEAMDDDLAVPQALAVLHDTIRSGNARSTRGSSRRRSRTSRGVMAMTDDAGDQPARPRMAGVRIRRRGPRPRSTPSCRRLIAQRAQARADKDWPAADRIRDAISAAGITLEDTPDGTHWSIDG